MKYSRLPDSELFKLEQEFIDFLVVNGIVADDWEGLKHNEPATANNILDQFSDVVWEGVLRKARYLKKREDDMIYYFKCEEEHIHLIRVQKQGERILKQTATKAYSGSREEEIHNMIVSGCEITEGEAYEQLA